MSDPLSFVVLPYAAFSNKNRSQKPFSKVLQPLKPARGTKTRENAFVYVFSAKCDGKTYWKVGNTSDVDTYHSKNRFCPFVQYDGALQVHGHGTLLERLLGRYLVGQFKASEWYYGCESQIDAFVEALSANAHFQKERPHVMKNVELFNKAFIGSHPSTVDNYLSLFRIEDSDGRLYKLTDANIELSLAQMLVPAFLDSEATDAVKLRAKRAAPAVTSSESSKP
jgi:hypothetical protein